VEGVRREDAVEEGALHFSIGIDFDLECSHKERYGHHDELGDVFLTDATVMTSGVGDVCVRRHIHGTVHSDWLGCRFEPLRPKLICMLPERRVAVHVADHHADGGAFRDLVTSKVHCIICDPFDDGLGRVKTKYLFDEVTGVFHIRKVLRADSDISKSKSASCSCT